MCSVCRSFGAVVLSLALAAPAFAQRAAGPNAGVLGTTDDATVRETLTVRGSLFGAWDDIVNETDNPDVDRRFLRSGFATGANGRLTHARRTTRTQWLSSADSSLRLYGSDSEDIAATFLGRSGVNSELNSRLTLSLSGGWLYSPYFELSPSYGSQFQNIGAFGGGFGLATAAERNWSADGRAGLNIRLSRRDTIELDVNGRRWKFLDQPESSVTFYGAHGRYRHTLTRAIGVYAGFGREEAKYELPDSRPATSDVIDLGIDYGDTLEFARRTALSFGFSTSAVRWEEDTHYRLNGSATLTQGIGRTGSGLLQYRRATEYTGGFREPLLTDTFSGGVSDQIGRDTSWSVNVGYVRGEIGFESESRRFDIYDVGGRLTRALTRHLGVFGDYTFYRYEVPSDATVFAFLPKFSRQSFSVGLTVWTPLINDTRPPREAR
ncbi:MAG TPA: hypothetical protein VFO21_00770 [Vicinamibacterales bacterium]|nr:hypothetical protein [Vicinamibacterales bacterium]